MADAHTTPQGGYEARDVRLTPIFKFTFWLSVGTVITLFAMFGMMRALQEIPPVGDAEPHPLAAQNDVIPPMPNLEAQRGIKRSPRGEQVDLQQRQPFTQRMWVDLKGEAMRSATSYEWVDREAKIVRIPIERAMELALQKGFPVAEKPKD
jgi:hypothetical protein